MCWDKIRGKKRFLKHWKRNKKCLAEESEVYRFRVTPSLRATVNSIPRLGTVEYKLAQTIADELRDLSREEIKQLYAYHLRSMRLMSQDGIWKSNLGDYIELPDLDGNGLACKCFESASLIADNPYLHECLLIVQSGLKGADDSSGPYPGSFRELINVMDSTLPNGETQKRVVFKDCVTLMVVLECLTRAASETKGVFEKMECVMGTGGTKVIQYIKNIAELGFFTGAKMSLVQKAAREIIKAEKTGKVRENFTHWLLFINIWMRRIRLISGGCK